MTPLKKVRLLSGKRQIDVFQETGIWPGRLSLIENGLLPPNADELNALGRLYGVDTDALQRNQTKARKALGGTK